jgi:cation transporter-like permease
MTHVGPVSLALVHVGPFGICGSSMTDIGLKLTLLTHVGPHTLALVQVGPMASVGSMLTNITAKVDPDDTCGPTNTSIGACGIQWHL